MIFIFHALWWIRQMHLPFVLPFTACPNQFQCKNHQCIRKELQCDGWSDCGDMSDEINCSKSVFIVEYKLCLFTTSCLCTVTKPNGFQRVSSLDCSADSLTCENGLCKPLFWKCDGVDDCGDKTDEKNCGVDLSEDQLSLHPLPSVLFMLCFSLFCFFSKVHANQDRWRATTENVCLRRIAATEETTVEMVQMSSTVGKVYFFFLLKCMFLLIMPFFERQGWNPNVVIQATMVLADSACSHP